MRIGKLGLVLATAAGCAIIGCSNAGKPTAAVDGSPSGAGGSSSGQDGAAPGLDGPASCVVPATFAWSTGGPVLSARSDATHNLVSIKDPSVVYFNAKWHVFVSTVSANGAYSMAYITFPDWDHTADATFYYLDQTPALRGYHAAPQVFFFAPQNKWYLIYQSGPPQYSTNDNIENPAGWTAPQSFYASEPDTVTQTKGTAGGWLDFWTICDDSNCYLFFSDDNGHWYRAQTPVANFPNQFGEPVVVLSDNASPSRVFEASNVYKLSGTDKYLALIEAYDAASNNRRYFRSWVADALDGDWTPLQDTYAMPFASTANVGFTQPPPWTQDISHGEMIRDGYDQYLTVDPCHLQFVYQGLDPASNGLPYNSLPWQLGLITTTTTN
jgi:endo-1,4-beta-xylanase